jgi:hypothetical protein
VTLASKREKPKEMSTLTATFNYNLEAKDLILLIDKILAVRIFTKSRFRIGHF